MLCKCTIYTYPIDCPSPVFLLFITIIKTYSPTGKHGTIFEAFIYVQNFMIFFKFKPKHSFGWTSLRKEEAKIPDAQRINFTDIL